MPDSPHPAQETAHWQDPEHLLGLILVAILVASALTLGNTPALGRFSSVDWGAQVFFILGISLGSAWLMDITQNYWPVSWQPYTAGLNLLIVLLCTAIASSGVLQLLPLAADALPAPGIHPVQWLIRNELMAGIIGGIILRYQYLGAALRRNQQAELQARIQSLQSRIRPHFLFNSMNLIASLIHADPEKAETAVEELSRLFRATLRETSEVSLDEEISLCQDYLDIETLRLGERLQVKWTLEHIDSALSIPLLTLQPIIENAIYYGVELRQEPSLIHLHLQYQRGVFSAQITNPLPPLASTSLTHGHQLALNNIRERLRAHYGEQARLKTGTDRNEFTTSLSYPIKLSRSL